MNKQICFGIILGALLLAACNDGGNAVSTTSSNSASTSSSSTFNGVGMTMNQLLALDSAACLYYQIQNPDSILGCVSLPFSDPTNRDTLGMMCGGIVSTASGPSIVYTNKIVSVCPAGYKRICKTSGEINSYYMGYVPSDTLSCEAQGMVTLR